MADLSLNSVLGIAVETTAGTYVAPALADLIAVADLRPSIEGITSDVREYTGSIHRPGPAVFGKTFNVTGRIYLRGPGGASPPAAGAWVPGRVLRAAGFAEQILSAAVPPAPEALAVGSTTGVANLGASGAATDDIYNGLLLALSGLGANRTGLSAVRDYTGSSKAARLAERAGAPITGNWQLPSQLTYALSPGEPPSLSVSCWIGRRRYNGVGCAISSFRFNLPAAGRESQELPSIEFTLSGDLASAVDEAPPAPPAGLAIPPFRDGKLWVSEVQVGGSSVTIDMGAQVGYPPNPNKPSGNDAAQLTETTRTVDMTLNQMAISAFDDLTMSDSQAYYPLFALWGLGSGNAFGLTVTDMRFAPRSPDNSGAFVTSTGQAYIDGANRTIALSIPFTSF
ncbi:hypothetical protein [Sphingomonas panaciterrae]|uniref:hypothetical protein n=1 Tax=Sphingomonas panaciterrae TaxID=1462999 RepID=UPI002FEE88F2